MLTLAFAVVPTFGALTCGADHVYVGMGTGGPNAAAAVNVTDEAACCTLCHGNLHDECVTWIFGESAAGAAGSEWSGDARGYPPHNCAIMPTYYAPRPTSGHTCGVVKAPAPTPAPETKGAACNADIDCAPLTAQFWRCAADPGAALNASSNCHLPGPGTCGNTTCACFAPRCSSTKRVVNASATTQYLMIGDSISLGMESDLAALVAQRGWQLTHSPGNAASSNLGAHCVADWLRPNGGAAADAWDVVSFQFGLHDLGFDTERISVAQYAALLSNITQELVALQRAQPALKLLWVKTTPVPTVPTYGPACNKTSECLNPPRFDRDVVLYNAAADAIVANANAAGARIATADLYAFVLARCGGAGYATCPGFQLPMNVHYTTDGWTALAAEMLKSLSAL